MIGKLNFNVLLKLREKDIFSSFSRMVMESAAEDKEEALRRIMAREGLGATAIGDDLPVPHAKVPGLKEPSVVIGVADEPLDYDGKAVRIIVMMLLPEDGSSSDVGLLPSLVSAVSSESGRERVLSAATAKEVEEVFLP